MFLVLFLSVLVILTCGRLGQLSGRLLGVRKISDKLIDIIIAVITVYCMYESDNKYIR